MGLLEQRRQRLAAVKPAQPLPTPQAVTTMGIIKNTITGLPQAAREVGAKIKDFLLSGRGFTDAAIGAAKPGVKDAALALPKLGAEIVGGVSGGVSALGTKALQSIPGLPQPKASTKLTDTLNNFAQPKSAEEAQAMRILDVATMGLGGGLKNVGKAAKVIAATEDAAVIARELKATGMANDMIQRVAPKLVKVKDPIAVSKVITTVQTPTPKGISVPEKSVPTSPRTKGVPPQVSPDPVSSSYAKDTATMANSKLNLEHLNISKEGKALLEQTVDEIKPLIEKSVGRVLTNKEALREAEKASTVFKHPKLRDDTLEWEAKMIRTRQKLAQAAETGTVDKEFIDTLLAVKTQGADIGRKLQSLSVLADPKTASSKQTVLEAVLKVNDNVDEILKAAEGVDFNDLNQATEFYRKFIKPRASDWVDLIRYNSMLSSPKTHIINTFSNALNTTLVAPLEKTLVGGLDFFGSKITGGARAAYAGEGASYAEGYLRNTSEAVRRFVDVMRGRQAYTNLDIKHIPISTKGAKGHLVRTLSYPMRLLEATDQFFMALTEGAEAGALEYRASKGVKVGNIETKAKEKAAYRLFRSELHTDEQGKMLNALDTVTAWIESLRNSDNLYVSIPAKFTVPFIRTPTNIFKQGIEYSPLGVLTLHGAKNKTEQIAKAMIGSAVFAGASAMLTSDRLSWGEPTNPDDKAAYRKAGKQPYSIKVGDKWLSYQKLPPPIAFPFALVAGIADAQKNKKMDDTTVDMVLSAVAKYGRFLSDQSYAKAIGDFLANVRGDEGGVSRIAANYTQQLIPFRAMGGWLARLTDEVQRKPDAAASFIDQQVQYMMMNIPGLTNNVPARLGPDGQPIKQQHRLFNAFSPIQGSTETPFAKKYDGMVEMRKIKKDITDTNAKKRDAFMGTYEEIQKLAADGKADEAKARVDALTDDEYESYKKIRSAERAKRTDELRLYLHIDPTQAVQYVRSQSPSEQKRLMEVMTDAEYALYQKGK